MLSLSGPLAASQRSSVFDICVYSGSWCYPLCPELALTFLGALQLHLNLCISMPAGNMCIQKQF